MEHRDKILLVLGAVSVMALAHSLFCLTDINSDAAVYIVSSILSVFSLIIEVSVKFQHWKNKNKSKYRGIT